MFSLVMMHLCTEFGCKSFRGFFIRYKLLKHFSKDPTDELDPSVATNALHILFATLHQQTKLDCKKFSTSDYT